jgi:putative transposase
MIGAKPQSLSKVILHIIFSTKESRALAGFRRAASHACVSGDDPPRSRHVGGVADHIHIVTALPRTLSQAQFIEQIKKPSSKWIKVLYARYRDFFLAEGLWCDFSEPESAQGSTAIHRDAARASSHLHVQEEYRELLRRHGIDFDERYVWD